MSKNVAKEEVTIAELIARIEVLEEKVANIKVRDRGPKSTRTMTDEDAFRVKFGDLADQKDWPHMKAAKELGLSYSQVYSARGDYTFTHIEEDWASKQEAEQA